MSSKLHVKTCEFCNLITEHINPETSFEFNTKTFFCQKCKVSYTFFEFSTVIEETVRCITFYHTFNNKNYKLMVSSRGNVKLFETENIPSNNYTRSILIKKFIAKNLKLNPESAKLKILTILTMI